MLTAYPGGHAQKAALLAQIKAHRLADEIVKGVYWQGGRGCAIGCALHSSDHMDGELRYGIPVMLWYLADAIFEGLPHGSAKEWVSRFPAAFEPGRDYSLRGWRFLHWLLTDETANPGIDHPLVREAVAQCAEVVESLAAGQPLDLDAASAARDAADSAADSASITSRWAENAAHSAMWSADSAVASAADSTERAAWSADSAVACMASVKSASHSVIAASMARHASTDAACSAGRTAPAKEASYARMADKLIELIGDVK